MNICSLLNKWLLCVLYHYSENIYDSTLLFANIYVLLTYTYVVINAPPMSEAECLATLIDCDLSVKKYKTICRRANKKGRRVFHSYRRLKIYKNENCMPKNIDVDSSATSIHVNLQDVLDHQVSKLLTPEIKDKMKVLASQGASFELQVKYGM